MFGFRKKNKTTVADIARDREVIAANIKSLERIRLIYAANKDASDALAKIADEYKFVSPKESFDTLKIDEKITRFIDDIEVIAKKTEKSNNNTELLEIIKKIRLAIAER
jgi:CO dehydrogenase/acetyl-CoA synthase gamma subunit (corrinoid Fe-S protein)